MGATPKRDHRSIHDDDGPDPYALTDTFGAVEEAPAGERFIGHLRVEKVYTEEQQQRLWVDALGRPRPIGAEHTGRAKSCPVLCCVRLTLCCCCADGGARLPRRLLLLLVAALLPLNVARHRKSVPDRMSYAFDFDGHSVGKCGFGAFALALCGGCALLALLLAGLSRLAETNAYRANDALAVHTDYCCAFVQ